MKLAFSLADIPTPGASISPLQFYILACTLFNLKERQAKNHNSPAAMPRVMVGGYTSFPNDETAAQIIEKLEDHLTNCHIDYTTTATNRTCFSGNSKCIVFRQRNLITNKITISCYERSKTLEKCGLTEFFQTSFIVYNALQQHHMGDFVNVYNPAVQIEIIYLC